MVRSSDLRCFADAFIKTERQHFIFKSSALPRVQEKLHQRVVYIFQKTQPIKAFGIKSCRNILNIRDTFRKRRNECGMMLNDL